MIAFFFHERYIYFFLSYLLINIFFLFVVAVIVVLDNRKYGKDYKIIKGHTGAVVRFVVVVNMNA